MYQITTFYTPEYDDVQIEGDMKEFSRYIIWDHFAMGKCRILRNDPYGFSKIEYEECAVLRPHPQFQPYLDFEYDYSSSKYNGFRNFIIGIRGNNIYVPIRERNEIIFVLVTLTISDLYDFYSGYEMRVPDHFKAMFRTLNINLERVDNIGLMNKILEKFKIRNFLNFNIDDMYNVLENTRSKVLSVVKFKDNDCIYRYDGNLKFVPSELYQPFDTINRNITVDDLNVKIETSYDLDRGYKEGKNTKKSYDELLEKLKRRRTLWDLGMLAGKLSVEYDQEIPQIQMTLDNLTID